MAKYKIIPSSRTIVQSPISIGHKAEKGVEAIEFDLTAWVGTYGSGTATIIMRRWGDVIPYPIALEIDENNKATWTLSDIDTAKAGMAYAQLNYIVGDEVVKKSDIYTFRVMDSLTGEGDPPEAYESWLEHLTHLAAEAMAEVLDIEGIVTDKTLTVDGGIADAKAAGDALALKADKSTTYTKAEVDQMIEGVEVETDTTLSVSGAPADAKKTGDEIAAVKADLDALDGKIDANDEKIRADLEELKPLTEDIKVALLNVASHIGLWSDGDGKKYYGALEAALYPYTGLVRISAVFTQGSAVISPFTPLNDLKAYLVVTGYYDDGTSKIITDYSLSGTLEVGTSTITVSKENKTDTFDVVVSSSYWDYEWYASSGIAPLDINGNPAYGLFVDGLFKLDESHPEFAYAKSLPVEVAIEFVSIVKVNNIPMFSFCYNYDSDGGDGFKIYNNSDGKVQTSVSGSSIATETDFHVGSELQSIHAIVASTGCSFEFGDISGSGTGVFNNQWLLGNNIAYPRLNTGGDIRLKSIKFKYLT